MKNKNDRERIVSEIIDGFFDGVHSPQVENRFFDWMADERDRDLKDLSMKRVWDCIDSGVTREGHKALARFKILRMTKLRRIWLKAAIRNAAAILLPPLAVAGIWLFAASGLGRPDANAAQSVQTPRETIVRVVPPEKGDGVATLPDNSTVTLAEGSRLIYTEETFRRERFVEMTGECGFWVVADQGAPFVVRTDNTAVTVLGTEFSVCDRPGSDVVVALVSGKVEVAFGKDNRSAVLVPGETLRFDPETGVSSIEAAPAKIPAAVVPASFPAQKEPETIGEFICDEMSIAEILSALENHYGFRITVDPLARFRGRYSVNFSGDERLETIMNVIGIMAGLEYVVSDDGREAFVASID